MSSKISLASELCTRCGLCCNGVLFKDVELQPGDHAEELLELGLKLIATARTTIKFQQPCPALNGKCRCRIYEERPLRCRQFECSLLQSAQAGNITVAVALSIIRRARQRVAKVMDLLRELGDVDEYLPLKRRFQRMKKRFESGTMDAGTAPRFGDLTLAMQDLNVLLSREFFP